MDVKSLRDFLADKADSDQIVISTNFGIDVKAAPEAVKEPQIVPEAEKASEAASESKAD